MATRTEIKATVQSRDNRELPATPATLTKVEFDKPERTKNAIRTFGMLIAATFASLFVHLLHFILVPTLFICSFVFAFEKLGEIFRREGGKGECTNCHKDFKVQSGKWAEKFTNICNLCGADLELKIVHLSE